MAKSLGNLFFEVSADATKFTATMDKVRKDSKATTGQQVKGAQQVQAGTKGMTLGFAAAAGAAAGFAFELVKSSELARFAIGVVTDAIEMGMVDAADKAASGVALVSEGLGKMTDANVDALESGKRNWQEYYEGSVQVGTGINRVGALFVENFTPMGGVLYKLGEQMGVDLPAEAGKGYGLMVTGAKNMQVSVADAIRAIPGAAASAFEAVKGALTRAWDGITWGAGQIWEGVKGGWEGFTTWLSGAWGALTWAGTGAWSAIQGGWSTFTTWLTDSWDALTWAGNTVWDAIKGGWSTFTAWLTTAWNDFWAGVTKAAGSVGEGVENVVEAISDAVPKFQAGGYVSSTGLALLHAGEYVQPASQVDNSRTMNVPQIVVNVMSPQGLSFGGGVALGQDMRAAITDSMRSVMNL